MLLLTPPTLHVHKPHPTVHTHTAQTPLFTPHHTQHHCLHPNVHTLPPTYPRPTNPTLGSGMYSQGNSRRFRCMWDAPSGKGGGSRRRGRSGRNKRDWERTQLRRPPPKNTDQGDLFVCLNRIYRVPLILIYTCLHYQKVAAMQ